jgi:hypothetical protein
MSSYSQLYWLTRLDYLQGLFLALAIVSGVLLIIWFLIPQISFDYEDAGEKAAFYKKYRNFKRTFIPLMITGIILSCLIPSREEAIFIMAGGKVLDFVKTDSSINKVPGQATEIISTMLDNEIKKLKATIDKK